MEEQTDEARQAAEEAQAEADDASDDVSEAAGNEENEPRTARARCPAGSGR
ncbi:MAG: hypothetical protein ACLUOI_21565 [Eisenbergiella sp.]